MNKSQKSLALSCLLLAGTLFSCKKDSKGPQVGELTTSREKIVVGQYNEITSDVSDADTDAGSLTYSWSISDGFKGTASKAEWTPAKSGSQTISLTVSDGDKSVTKTKDVSVSEADFRRAIWGNTRTEVQLYELKAGKNPTGNTPEYLVYQGTNTNSLDLYVMTDNVVSEGITGYTNSYSSNYNQYIVDYNNVVNALKAKYGNYASNKIYYKDVDARDRLSAHPELWADAVVAGDARLVAVWNVGNNTISHELFRSASTGNATSATYYFRKSTTASTSSFDDAKITGRIEKLLNSALQSGH